MEGDPDKLIEKGLRIQQVEKIVGFLNKVGAYEYAQKLISNPELRAEFPFEEFKDFLVRLNGIARDIPINQRKSDGENVYISGFDEALVPNHKDKEDILMDSYNAINKVSSEDISYLLPAVINAVHLFADGNGRTSRILHTLLTKFESPDDFIERLRLAVGEDGRIETEDINPSIVGTDINKIVLIKHGFQFENDKDWSPIFPKGFCLLFIRTEKVTSKKAQEFVGLLQTDQPECFISASEYLTEKGILSQNVSHLDDGVALSPLKMEQNLTDADWDAIMERYYSLKKEHVEILIDSFVKPDTYKNLDSSMNLRDYFLMEIRKRYMANNQHK